MSTPEALGTGDTGGSTLTIGGTLTNAGDLDIGNGFLTTPATVIAAGLSNAATGPIDLIGGSAQATLDITAAAPATLTGFVFLQGDALLEFASGHITTIAANSELSLSGAQSRISDGNSANNTALTQLASNNGILDLESTTLTTTTALW